MIVRCKMTVDKKEARDEGFEIVMNPVIGGSPENDEFYAYTPGGSLVLDLVREQTADFFEIGSSYYLNIEKA